MQGDCCEFIDFPLGICLPGGCPECFPPTVDQLALQAKEREIGELEKKVRVLNGALLEKVEEVRALRREGVGKLRYVGLFCLL